MDLFKKTSDFFLHLDFTLIGSFQLLAKIRALRLQNVDLRLQFCLCFFCP